MVLVGLCHAKKFICMRVSSPLLFCVSCPCRSLVVSASAVSVSSSLLLRLLSYLFRKIPRTAKTKLPSTYSIGYSPDCCQFLTMTWLYRSWHIFSLDEHLNSRRGRKPSLLSKALHLRACRNCTCTYLCVTLEAEGAMTRQGNSN